MLPAEALSWLRRITPATRVTPLGAEVYAVDDAYVLRRVRVANEARVLALLDGTALPVPRVVAYDASGAEAGVPSLLVTRLPGAPDLSAPRPAPVVPEVPLPQGFRTFRRYAWDVALEPPTWSTDDALWRDAIALAQGEMPAYRPVFVHRDLHPGNVLYTGERLTGVVDWVEACAGPAAIDRTHYQANVAMLFGPDAATPTDPYWDAVTATDFLVGTPPDAHRLEAHLTRCLTLPS